MASRAETILDRIKEAESKSPRQELAKLSLDNLDIVDDVVDLAKKLDKKKQSRDARTLIEIAKKILANNKRLQNTVGRMSR